MRGVFYMLIKLFQTKLGTPVEELHLSCSGRYVGKKLPQNYKLKLYLGLNK